MNIERTTDVGKLIQMYRDNVEDALKVSRQLEDQSIERPWIVVKCSRRECASYVLVTGAKTEVQEHTHRIRLEIR